MTAQVEHISIYDADFRTVAGGEQRKYQTAGQLWEREAERNACAYEHTHGYDDATGERYCELPSQASILYGLTSIDDE